MKGLVFLCLVILTACVTTQKSSVQENQLFLTRKYIGNFVEYRQHIPDKFNEPYLIWIKTSMDSTYGKISAYGQKCEFKEGDRLYIKRTYYTPGSTSGYWVYQVESDDSKTFYRLSDFQHDRQVLVNSWF